MEEKVKFYYFWANPTATNSSFMVTLNITSLAATYNNNFYPTVLIVKNAYTSQPSDMRTLTYPNLLRYDMKFGDNFAYLTNHDNVSITNSFLKH